jgi:large subunit ribosomal protein L19
MAEQAKQPKASEMLRYIEQQQVKPDVPTFRVGDMLDVGVQIREGGKERIQVFSGICIARKGSGNRETFTVRRVVQGEGVERVFPLHSPNVRSITVVRRGRVRRAKLNYLKQLTGRATRVQEDLRSRPEDRQE